MQYVTEILYGIDCFYQIQKYVIITIEELIEIKPKNVRIEFKEYRFKIKDEVKEGEGRKEGRSKVSSGIVPNILTELNLSKVITVKSLKTAIRY